MNTITLSVVFAAVTMLAACTSTSNQSGSKYATQKTQDPDKVTCKSVVRTGTRLGSRMCLTNRDWALQRENSREAVEQIQRESAQTGTTGD